MYGKLQIVLGKLSMKNVMLFLMFVMLTGLCFGGDFIFPDDGDKIIWPSGEMEFGLDTFPAIDFGEIQWLNAGSLSQITVSQLEIISRNVGGFSVIRSDNSWIINSTSQSAIQILKDGGEIIMSTPGSNITLDAQDGTIHVVGDLAVTGIVTAANLGGAGSLKLLGSSVNEFLVVAQYIDVVQQAGANKFELRLSGTFTGGSDTDYELEIDGTSPATFKWRKDTGGGFGAYTTEVAVPNGFAELDEAIVIAFLDSGSDVFVIGDDYSFTAVNNPTTILNVDTLTGLVTTAALNVNGALDMNGNDITDTGDVIPVDSAQALGSGSKLWSVIYLDGKIGIQDGVDFNLDFNIDGQSFDFFNSLGTDTIINLDGSGANTGTFTYESDNDLFILDTALNIGDGTNETQFSGTGDFTQEGTAITKLDQLYLIETTTPTPIDSHGAVYTKSTNVLFFQSGDGVEHILHGDAFSNIWVHSPTSVEVAIAVQDSFTVIDSFAVVGHEDDLGNLIGNTTTNSMTLAATAGGEYELSYHGSVTATGGADKEMSFAVGITLATPKDITNVTDNGVSPIVITSAAHEFENGDMVQIVGVLVNTAANGSFIVDSEAPNTFEIVALDGGATTGNGDYDEGTPTGDITIVYPGNMEIHRMVRGADFGSIAAADLHVLSGGDAVKLYVANLSGVTNLTVSSLSLSGFRIGD